jgi:hypothetical protein
MTDHALKVGDLAISSWPFLAESPINPMGTMLIELTRYSAAAGEDNTPEWEGRIIGTTKNGPRGLRVVIPPEFIIPA